MIQMPWRGSVKPWITTSRITGQGVFCTFHQIDLRDDPKTLARLLYMKEKPLTYEHGVKLAKEVTASSDATDLSTAFHWVSFIQGSSKAHWPQTEIKASVQTGWTQAHIVAPEPVPLLQYQFKHRISWGGRVPEGSISPIPEHAQGNPKNHTMCQRQLSKHFWSLAGAMTKL